MSSLLDSLRAALSPRYEVEREIGRGGMAIVFLARDPKHDRKVALKVLRPEIADSVGPERFLREIRIAAGLSHPNILPLFDSGEAGGLLYYVMPYVEGESLRGRLEREKQLPVEEALQIVGQVAEALEYAHGQGVVHRDIKPGNILFEAGRAVVTDFGVARAVSEAGEEKLTESGLAVGTAAYMSPEQATGSGEVDGRSDLYALGCVLYECLAGESPFTGPSQRAVLARHCADPVPNVRTLRPTVPEHVVAAIERALAKVPADRFATGAEFRQRLRDSALSPTGRRRFPWRAVAAATGVLVAAALGWSLLGPSTAPVGEASAEPAASIAVLPFENRSAEGENAAFFADGIHDDVLTQLSKIGSLRVISRTSVMGYRGQRSNVREIADELGVGTILEGSVQRSGERVRLNVQLIDAREDRHLWAETYDRELTPANVFDIQTEIAERIAAEMAATLTPEERERIRARPTDDLDAYEAYLRGVQILHRYEVGDFEEAAARLERAVELDPEFAEAHARLAEAYFGLGWRGLVPEEEAFEMAVGAARRALELDETLGEAHATLALVAEGRGEYAEAEREYRRAIELSPGFAVASEWYADMLLVLGRAKEALPHFLRAHELNPQSRRIAGGVGQAYYFSRDYGRAIDHLARWSRDLSDDSSTRGMLWVLASAQAEDGRYAEAIATDARRSELATARAPTCLYVCAIVHARAGRGGEARGALGRLLAWRESSGPEPPFEARADFIARVYAALDDPDAAFTWLERGWDEYELRHAYLKPDPQWDPIRADPRFEALLRRMGLI